MTTSPVLTVSEAISQPNGLRCQLPECGKALVGTQEQYCSRSHTMKDFYQRLLIQPNGLRCRLPGCGKELVGPQQKYCSGRHCTLAATRRSLATRASSPTGFVCKLPGCGKALMGKQKTYCSPAHRVMASTERLVAESRTERSRRRNRIAMLAQSPSRQMALKQRVRYKGLILPLHSDDQREAIILRAEHMIAKRQRLAGVAHRLKHGGLLECPRCGSHNTQRHGHRGACLSEGCGRTWTIGKDYTPLICGRCGGNDTKKGGYGKTGRPQGYCDHCQQKWTIGHDYGTPFTPAMVDLLRTAHQTTLTAEEEAEIADILESTHPHNKEHATQEHSV
jgi:hypothetical protein